MSSTDRPTTTGPSAGSGAGPSAGPTSITRSLGDGSGVVHVEDVFATSAADLWSAITDPGRLSRWLVTDLDGDPRLGGTVQVRFTSGCEGAGRIEVCDEPRRVVVILDPGTEEETTIEATLTPEGAGTRLVVEERGVPLSQLPAFGAGWQVHAEDLATFLGGDVPGDWATRWAELRTSYGDGA